MFQFGDLQYFATSLVKLYIGLKGLTIKQRNGDESLGNLYDNGTSRHAVAGKRNYTRLKTRGIFMLHRREISRN